MAARRTNAVMTIDEFVATFGGSRSGVRRWIAAGMPCEQRGSRGRGRVTLLDPEKVERWRRGHVDARLHRFASEIPDIVARALADTYREAHGPFKVPMGGHFRAAWFAITNALLDRIRADVPDLPELHAVPDIVSHFPRPR